VTYGENAGPVAVVGATGRQGGAAIDALLKSGTVVRAAVRDPKAPKAVALAERGVELAVVHLDEPDSVRALFDGAAAAFAMTTMTGPGGTAQEIAHGRVLAEAAAQTNLPFFVYSSVGGSERHSGVPHFESKHRVERYLLDSVPVAFVRPTWFMENLPSKLERTDGAIRLVLPLDKDASLQMVSVRTIGAAAAAFILNRPEHGASIEVAGDDLTGEQIADHVSDRLGIPTAFVHQSVDDVTHEDQAAMWRWLNEPPAYQADFGRTRALVPDVENLLRWLARQRLD
jgi:uncharacterized protein YbjT (DUF2867 family)